jgi:hypothetical protein
VVLLLDLLIFLTLLLLIQKCSPILLGLRLPPVVHSLALQVEGVRLEHTVLAHWAHNGGLCRLDYITLVVVLSSLMIQAATVVAEPHGLGYCKEVLD